jgi:hypothetical protein
MVITPSTLSAAASLAGDLTSKTAGVLARFTPDQAITITRERVDQLTGAEITCQSPAVLKISKGTKSESAVVPPRGAAGLRFRRSLAHHGGGRLPHIDRPLRCGSLHRAECLPISSCPGNGTCSSISNRCGGTLNCGSCSAGQS